ncbi:MAG: 50S ribosome-binding GTPase [Neomegalonema sp.]|nr:50S ribosome-binding GTPase [Neomegalonema sp.]
MEEGIEATIRDEAGRRIARLAADLGHHAEAARQASLDVQTPTVALIGRPNAGKSSLLNAILEQDAAIVSSRAGTTRDAVSGDLILNGLRIRVVDTAGMRETDDAVESEGVERAKRVAARADLRILVISHDSGEPTDEMLSLVTEADIVFWTKADVAEPGSGALERFPRSYVVSSRDGSAARAFDAALAAAGFGARSVISPIAGSERRARLVQDAKLAIDRAMGLLRQDGVEAAIEELRLAAGTLERLVGQIDHEDVLDALFSRFCIGK